MPKRKNNSLSTHRIKTDKKNSVAGGIIGAVVGGITGAAAGVALADTKTRETVKEKAKQALDATREQIKKGQDQLSGGEEK